MEPQAIATLAQLCDGDARSALNGLQIAVQAKREKFQQQNSKHSDSLNSASNNQSHSPEDTINQDLSSVRELQSNSECSNVRAPEMRLSSPHLKDSSTTTTTAHHSHSADFSYPFVTTEDVKESLQRSHLLYDRAGEEHYNIISALHKSMRGSDASTSLYWLARMLCAGEDPLYVARRVVRFASEDIGEIGEWFVTHESYIFCIHCTHDDQSSLFANHKFVSQTFIFKY